MTPGRSFRKPLEAFKREPTVTLSWHRCAHPKGLIACLSGGTGIGCDKGEVTR